MRRLLTSFVLAGCVASPAIAFQAGSAAPTGTPAIHACSILTKELAEPFTENKKVFDVLKPSEEPYGTGGSACNYGAVRLQIAPARAGSARKAPTGDSLPLAGVGETAYFRNNRDTYAELVTWSGAHYIMLQLPVPMGSTAEATKPKAVALAKAVIAKLP